jgi:putative SOS response-associated peptidase YedK
MCGRYYSLFDKQQIAEHFHVRSTADNVGIIAPNWNAAPGDPQPVIRRSRDTGERELVMMRWGIIPWFATSEEEFKALSTVNAKSDRLIDGKIWRETFAKPALSRRGQRPLRVAAMPRKARRAALA